MILINRILPDSIIQPLTHKGDNPVRNGEIMTDHELHELGIALLTVYLYKPKGELIRYNDLMGNEYPHLIAKNPKGVLLYIWVKTEVYTTIPRVMSIEKQADNHINLYSILKILVRKAGIETSAEIIPFLY